MYNGLLNIYKEKDFTSHDVVAKLRGILRQKKIGHAGTLDPNAEGVLPVCLGKGTKLCDMLTGTKKQYQVSFVFEKETDTEDIWGTVTNTYEPLDTEAPIKDTILSFVGEYDQIPPMYSAKKINGKKLYELAREGKVIERKPERIKIYDITNIDNSPDIKQYMRKNRMLIETTRVKTKALKTAINGKNTYQCEDQFADLSEVVIYRNGRRVKPENYTLFKQGKVQFNDCEKVVQGQVFFEYDRNVKHYKPYSNDLSCEVSEFQDVHNGSEGMMYSFVPDPTGEKRNVLMINCKSLLKEASNMRQQFSLAKYPLTYFKDRIKFFLPEDMKEAMLSYPKAITWFSIQESWCNFGSSTGQKTDMYSGSANSFGISKPAPDSKELYFHLLCRRRHCDVNIGLENYDDLNDELSSFLVKAGEWITIEREWKVGNPGICNHTIIDSEGRHEFYVNAYNSVCDPENEPERYADRYAGTNPYNVCFPFICKLYTSKELAQYCIDMIGSCYLYYKDYELIEAENVNALNKE